MTIGGGGARCCKYCMLSNGGSLATQRPPRCWASLRHHKNTRCKANTCSCKFPQQLLLLSTKFPLPYHWRSTFWADHAMNPAGGIFFHTLEVSWSQIKGLQAHSGASSKAHIPRECKRWASPSSSTPCGMLPHSNRIQADTHGGFSSNSTLMKILLLVF